MLVQFQRLPVPFLCLGTAFRGGTVLRNITEPVIASGQRTPALVAGILGKILLIQLQRFPVPCLRFGATLGRGSITGHIAQPVVGEAQGAAALVAGVLLIIQLVNLQEAVVPFHCFRLSLRRILVPADVAQPFVDHGQVVAALIAGGSKLRLLIELPGLAVEGFCFGQRLGGGIHPQDVRLEHEAPGMAALRIIQRSGCGQHLSSPLALQAGHHAALILAVCLGGEEGGDGLLLAGAQCVGNAQDGPVRIGGLHAGDVFLHGFPILVHVDEQMGEGMLIQVGELCQGVLSGAALHHVAGHGADAHCSPDTVMGTGAAQQIIPEALGKEGDQPVVLRKRNLADQRTEYLQLLAHVVLVVARDCREQGERDGLIGHCEQGQQRILLPGELLILVVLFHSAVQVLGVALLQAAGKDGIAGELQPFLGGLAEEQGEVLKVAVAGVEDALLQGV